MFKKFIGMQLKHRMSNRGAAGLFNWFMAECDNIAAMKNDETQKVTGYIHSRQKLIDDEVPEVWTLTNHYDLALEETVPLPKGKEAELKYAKKKFSDTDRFQLLNQTVYVQVSITCLTLYMRAIQV
jgi:hypothetical protein